MALITSYPRTNPGDQSSGGSLRGRTPGLPTNPLPEIARPVQDIRNDYLASQNNYSNTTQSGDDGGSSAQDEWASWWRDMQKYLKTLYEKEVRNNRENFESSRDQINLNRARNDRIFRAMSDPDSGRGMSIRARNNSNWINNLATARNTLANANDTSLANYHQNLANARSNYINQYMALMNSHHH